MEFACYHVEYEHIVLNYRLHFSIRHLHEIYNEDSRAQYLKKGFSKYY